MKVLVFQIGTDRYGLPLAAIARVLPAVALKHLPQAPAFVAGLMDLHGESVPVIDLSLLAGMAAGPVRYDTRIILVDYRLADGASAGLGLLAEHVAGVDSIDPAALRQPGVEGAPFLGQVASGAHGMLQLVELDHLLTGPVRALLFQPRAAP